MMFLKSSIGFIAQVLLVIAAVVAFSFIDPFGILNTTRLDMKNTAVAVEKIKDIGQLISAEYYGEVLKSSTELDVIDLAEARDSIRANLLEVHAFLQQAVQEIKAEQDNKNLGRNRLWKLFEQDNEDILTHPFYPDYKLLLTEKRDRKLRNDKTLIKWHFDNFDGKSIDIKRLADNAYLKEKYDLDEGTPRSIRKEQLVILGRGWVKAGIDFQSFTDSRIHVAENADALLVFLYVKPRILSATINPWLSPELNIKGFEILTAGRKVQNKPELVKEVKSACLEQLKNDALQADLLEKAEAYAETSLTNLFSLLTEREVHVKIQSDPLEYYRYQIALDSMITIPELTTIDTTVTNYADTLPKNVRRFLDSLNTYQRKDTFSTTINPYIALYDRMEADSLYDAMEQSLMEDLRNKVDELALKDYLYYMPDSSWQKVAKKQVVRLEMFSQDTVYTDITATVRAAKENAFQELEQAVVKLPLPDSLEHAVPVP